MKLQKMPAGARAFSLRPFLKRPWERGWPVIIKPEQAMRKLPDIGLTTARQQSWRRLSAIALFFVDWLRIRRHLIAKGCLPKGFDLRSIYTKVLIGQSCSEHALFISRKTRTDRKYFAKSLKHENPEKMLMERNRPVETSQPVEEDNLFKQTGFSSNFPIGSTKSVCSIHFLSGIIGIFVSIVNNPSLISFISIHTPLF